jgi:hypothetical protein
LVAPEVAAARATWGCRAVAVEAAAGRGLGAAEGGGEIGDGDAAVAAELG